MSKTQRVLEALEKGQELTAKQIATRYKLASPSSTISALRKQGYPIYLNARKGYNGDTLMKYRLGTHRQTAMAV
jgi:biotin operon repressor